MLYTDILCDCMAVELKAYLPEYRVRSNEQFALWIFEWKMDKELSEKCHGPIEIWDVSQVTNMKCAFFCVLEYPRRHQTFLDLSLWDVSNVTNMEMMFFGCKSLRELKVDTWDVSNVTNMDSMFFGCHHFNSSLTKWNVSNVTNMRNMFGFCTQFNTSLQDWNVSNVQYMDGMFECCFALQPHFYESLSRKCV